MAVASEVAPVTGRNGVTLRDTLETLEQEMIQMALRFKSIRGATVTQPPSHPAEGGTARRQTQSSPGQGWR